jgi:SPP1 family predicted phage head-tail adaptor
MSKTFEAGALRHRIAIDRQVTTQDPQNGALDVTWRSVATNVPAAIAPLSGKEFDAAAQVEARVTARITIRYRTGLNSAMRIRHGKAVYRILAILPDNKSGLEWLTILGVKEE